MLANFYSEAHTKYQSTFTMPACTTQESPSAPRFQNYGVAHTILVIGPRKGPLVFGNPDAWQASRDVGVKQGARSSKSSTAQEHKDGA